VTHLHAHAAAGGQVHVVEAHRHLGNDAKAVRPGESLLVDEVGERAEETVNAGKGRQEAVPGHGLIRLPDDNLTQHIETIEEILGEETGDEDHTSRLNRIRRATDSITTMSPARVALLLVVSLLAGCGADTAVDTTTAPTTTTLAPTTTTTTPGPTYPGFEVEGAVDGTLVALAPDGIDVYAAPGEGQPMLTLPKTTVLGTTTVLALVDQPVDGWAEVMLPVRPNGSTGWIPVDAVALFVVSGKIDVDLSDRELVYRVAGEERFRAAVAIGTPSNPTPTGYFFVTDRVRVGNQSGPWGPAAIGLSARSDTITEFNGGDGIVGIHGTNRPGLIGQAVSLGCIRLNNEMIELLHSIVPIGTPVEIRA
jgi:lipoprotein-anchoring transpeptidase ErfK/SrfK